jgi:murein DD-endopeptidase MepM/ murein hydrolase activator NlpD
MGKKAAGAAPLTPNPGPDPASSQESGTAVVRRGDCLSRICADRLHEGGGAVSPREIYAAVQVVAKANHLADPNRIYPGQDLDLSSLAKAPSSRETPDATSVHESPKPWQSLVKGAVAVSSGFGWRKDPFTGQPEHHNGIDVVAPLGAPISAFKGGTVTFAGWKSGYGNTVVIRQDDGLVSLYGHISESLVNTGQQVEAQMPIARVGSSGRSTGPHLLFEVRKNGKAIDPMTLFDHAS